MEAVPIANLVGQLGERDDDIRAVLASGFDRWEAHIRAGLAAMVAAGELQPDADVEWLAASTLASLQGGLILSQARRDPLPSAGLSTARWLLFTPTDQPANSSGSAAYVSLVPVHLMQEGGVEGTGYVRRARSV